MHRIRCRVTKNVRSVNRPESKLAYISEKKKGENNQNMLVFKNEAVQYFQILRHAIIVTNLIQLYSK